MTMTMPAPIIDQITPDHLRDMLILERDAYPEHLRWTLPEFQWELLQGRYARGIFVRDSRGAHRVAAFLIAEKQRKKYEILNLTVGIGCRRVGFGRRLVEELQHHCRQQAGKPFRIETLAMERNLELIAFLKAMGFVGSLVKQPLADCEDDAIEFVWRAT